MDVALKRKNLPLYEGRIELCACHTRLAHERGGRLNLNWLAIEQAIARDKART